MIVKRNSRYEVRSETGAKRLGSYTRKTQAVKRLQQVEWFKSHKSSGKGGGK